MAFVLLITKVYKLYICQSCVHVQARSRSVKGIGVSTQEFLRISYTSYTPHPHRQLYNVLPINSLAHLTMKLIRAEANLGTNLFDIKCKSGPVSLNEMNFMLNWKCEIEIKKENPETFFLFVLEPYVVSPVDLISSLYPLLINSFLAIFLFSSYP